METFSPGKEIQHYSETISQTVYLLDREIINVEVVLHKTLLITLTIPIIADDNSP